MKLLFVFSTMIYTLKALRIFGIHNVLKVIFKAAETLRVYQITISKDQVNLIFTIRRVSIGHNNNITYRRNVMIIELGTY